MCQFSLKHPINVHKPSAAKEPFENNFLHCDTMKNFARAYLSNWQCLFQETVLSYFARVESEENLFRSVFFNTNLPEQRIAKLLYKKELSELPDDSSDIFKKINIDLYMWKDQVHNSRMKNNMLWMICYA